MLLDSLPWVVLKVSKLYLGIKQRVRQIFLFGTEEENQPSNMYIIIVAGTG